MRPGEAEGDHRVDSRSAGQWLAVGPARDSVDKPNALAERGALPVENRHVDQAALAASGTVQRGDVHRRAAVGPGAVEDGDVDDAAGPAATAVEHRDIGDGAAVGASRVERRDVDQRALAVAAPGEAGRNARDATG